MARVSRFEPGLVENRIDPALRRLRPLGHLFRLAGWLVVWVLAATVLFPAAFLVCLVALPCLLFSGALEGVLRLLDRRSWTGWRVADARERSSLLLDFVIDRTLRTLSRLTAPLEVILECLFSAFADLAAILRGRR